MNDLVMRLRELAEALLRDGTVELIVGYENGSVPLRTSPSFVRKPEDAGKLVWDARCENNLATYLRAQQRQGVKGKVGVVAKGCDGRAIVGTILEKQVDRERLYIIAVPCQGVLDRKKVEQRLAGKEVLAATLNDGEVALETVGDGNGTPSRVSLPLADLLCNSCQTCQNRTAPLYDALLGDPAPAVEMTDDFAEVKALEAMSAEDKWAYFTREYSKCIRCYACREACPLCYCSECFVDQTQPAWFGKTDDLSDTMAFHLVRALHLAGRCVDCGACSRACPMGINLRALNRKLIKDVAELYGFTSGMDLEAVPPLSTFQPNDPQEFIK